jgi:hypothetical protein
MPSAVDIRAIMPYFGENFFAILLATSRRGTVISEGSFGTPQISPKIRHLRFGLNLAASLMKEFDISSAIMAENSCI